MRAEYDMYHRERENERHRQTEGKRGRVREGERGRNRAVVWLHFPPSVMKHP